MARKGIGAYVTDDTRLEQLRPVAEPVNTYFQPAQDGVLQAVAKAKVVENNLEAIGRPIEQMFKEQVAEQKEMRSKEQKVEALMAAHGEFYPWFNENQEKFSGLSPDQLHGAMTQAFTERFGQEPDRLKSYALKELLTDSITRKFREQSAKVAAAAEEKRYGDFAITAGETVKRLKAENATPEQIAAELDGLFTLNKGRLDPQEMNRRLLAVQETFLEEEKDRTKWNTAIHDYLKGKKLDQTNNPAYNTSFDRIRTRMNTATAEEKETYQIQFDREAEAGIAAGWSKKTLEQWFDGKLSNGALQFGITNATRSRLVDAVEKRDKKWAAASSKATALDAAVQTAIVTGVMPVGKHTYTTELGETKTLSEAEIERGVSERGAKLYLSGDKPDIDGFYNNIVAKVRVSGVSERLEAGIASLSQVATDKNEIEITGADGKKVKSTRAMQLVQNGFEEYLRVRKAGGDHAIAVNLPNETMRRKYEDMYRLHLLGYSTQHIATSLASGGNGSVAIDNKLLEGKVKTIANVNDMNPMNWGKNDALDLGYIRKEIKEGTEALMRFSGISQSQAQEVVTKRFLETHAISKKGYAYVPINHPSVGRFGSTENYLGALDSFTEAWKAEVVARSKEQGRDASKMRVMLTAHPYRHGYFLLKSTDGDLVSEVFGGTAQAVNADEIYRWWNAKDAEKANSKRK